MVKRFRRLGVHRAPNVTWDHPEDKVFDKEVKSVRKGVGMRVGDTVSSYYMITHSQGLIGGQLCANQAVQAFALPTKRCAPS